MSAGEPSSRPAASRTRHLIANSAWQVADRLLRMALGLVVMSLTARHLGVAGFGEISYAVACAALAGAIINLGIDSLVVRDLVRRPEDSPIILGTAFRLKALASIVALAGTAAWLLAAHGGEPVVWTVAWTAAALVFQPFETVDCWFQAKVQARIPVIVRLAAFVAGAGWRLVLVGTGGSIEAFAAASLLEGALAVFAWIWAYRWAGASTRGWRWSTAEAVALVRSGWPMLISALAYIAYQRADQLLVMHWRGEHELGLYGIAVRVCDLFAMVPLAVCTTVFPGLLRLREEDPASYRRRFVQLYRGMIVLGLGAGLGSLLLAGQVVHLLFGPAFADAVPALVLRSWSCIFVFLWLASGQWYIAEGLTGLAALRNLAGLAACVALSWALIPGWGAEGAAVATIGSFLVSGFLVNAVFPRTREAFIQQATAFIPRVRPASRA